MTIANVVKASKYRILCLHGIGENSEVFEAQTAPLTYQLGEEYQFDFVEGSYPWPASKGIAEVFGHDQIYYSYFDGSAENICKVLKDLGEYATENGPFDAVMGFSLGAALAVTFLISHENLGFSQTPFKSAILMCSTLPCDWNYLEHGDVRYLSSIDVMEPIQIPTIHFWSPEDVDYPGQSSTVVQMCDATKRVEITHNAGHNLPTKSNEMNKLAGAIKMMMVEIHS